MTILITANLRTWPIAEIVGTEIQTEISSASLPKAEVS